MKNMSKSNIGIMISIVAVIIWSGNFVISRGLNEIATPLTISFWRWLLAVVILFPIAYPGLKREWKYIKEQKVLIFFSGLTGVAVYSVLIYLAGHTTTAGNMSLLVTIGPAFTIIIMRVLYKDRLTPRKILGVCITLVGVIFLVTKGDINKLIHFDFSYGDLLVIIDTLIWSVYSILNKFRRPKLSAISYLFGAFFVGLMIIVPFYGAERLLAAPQVFNATTMGSYLYLAIGPSVIAFFLWNKAIEYIGATKTAILYNLIPVFSCILAVVILGETIQLVQVISMIVIVSGIVLATVNQRKV